MLETVIEYLPTIALWASAGIGAASLIVKGIELITDITPSKKDDEVMDTIGTIILKLQRLLSKVAANPKTEAPPKPEVPKA